MHTFNASTWETEAGGSLQQSQPGLQVSQGYTLRPYLKKKKKNIVYILCVYIVYILCAYVFVGMGQGSPSTFMWVLRVELRSSGLYAKYFSLLSHLTAPLSNI